MNYVIIGVGAAGIAAAKKLRSEEPDARITMISKDSHVHARHLLHKFLTLEKDVEGMSFVPADFFEKNRIEWRAGQIVTSLQLAQKQVTLASGETVPYDKLLIATGANSFILPIGDLPNAPNVFGLRHLTDAVAINEKAKTSTHVVIIGSGLVGLDAALGMCQQDKQVTIVERGDRILPVQMDKKGAIRYQAAFENKACRFYVDRGTAQTKVNEQGEVVELVFDNGESIQCDMVIVAAGVRAAVEPFKESGLTIERGIVVDSHMQSSDADVYAAGDVAGISGIWPSASKQGEVAALNMMGRPTEYQEPKIPKNAFNYFGLASLAMGKSSSDVAADGERFVTSETSTYYKKAVIKEHTLEGFLIVGDLSHAAIYQYLVASKADITGLEDVLFSASFREYYELQKDGTYLLRTAVPE
ncbi:MAG: NAD(P)/FAD-dependent oxidoreductase [Lachnospiraceae bacterium]